MNRPPVDIPADLRKAARIFAEHSRQCWLVGGAVRDGLLGRKSDDFDLATDAPPEQVSGMFRRTVPTGIRHGTVTILIGDHQFETTTFRKDGKYSDGRRPDQVLYAQTIEEDLARRDFTINAIAWDLIGDRLIDPHGGRKDIGLGLIRAIGDPVERFGEDALRSIRACRFAAQLGFRVDKPTLAAISTTLERIPSISVERIWEEIRKILTSIRPSAAFVLFSETGLLDLLLPELAACRGIGQKGRHVLDVFRHSLLACDRAPPANLHVRAAALLHDIGKPVTRRISDEEEVVFYRHDTVGAQIAEAILTRYKVSNADRERITRLVQHHMFHYTDDWTDAAVRRFISRVGLDLIDDLMELRRADASSIAPDLYDATAHLIELADRVDRVIRDGAALKITDLAVDGRDLITELGLTPGPRMGDVLRHLLECVLEDPQANRKDTLLDMAKRWLDVYG